MEPRGREQHRWANREVEMRGSTCVKARVANEFQWSEWDKRHGRWPGIATREECLAVERCGRSRDTMERMG